MIGISTARSDVEAEEASGVVPTISAARTTGAAGFGGRGCWPASVMAS